MLEFDVDGHHYRARKMNAFQQFHVARRLAPLISEMLQMGDALRAMGEDPKKLIVPFADALSRVSDDDCNYVLGVCLSMVQRMQGGNGAGIAWADAWSERAHRVMFEDIDNLQPMMEIVVNVLMDNLQGFFGGVMTGPEQTSPTPTLTPLNG